MNPKQLDALEQVLEYLSSEKQDFELGDKPENHIYRSVDVLEQLFAEHGGVDRPRKRLKADKHARKLLSSI